MEVGLKEYMTEHMKNKTSITIPIVMRNKLYLMKKRGEAMYDVIGRLLVLHEKVEKIKKRKRKENLTKKKLEAKKNARTKIERESIKI